MLIAAIIIGIVLISVVIFMVTYYFLTRNFEPTKNKNEQLSNLNSDIEKFGFAYDLDNDYFYSLTNCWQREMGYCRLYDETCPLINLITDCEPITFSYGGKRWLIELWKGQYGITTGGEIGIYNTTMEDIDSEKFHGTFYESVTDEEQLNLSFVLRKNRKVLIRRKGLHWWLTGFKLGEFSNPSSLTMDVKIEFPNNEMCLAFVDALYKIGYDYDEFSVKRNTVYIDYTTPHTPQTMFRDTIQEAIAQQTNESNCKLYEMSTSDYSNTLDKIELIKFKMPVIYNLFVKSIAPKELYEAFEWIKDLLSNDYE